MHRTTMAAGGKERASARYFARYTKKYHGLLALGMLFLCGVGLGALLLRTSSTGTLRFLLDMVGRFLDNRQGQALLDNFLSGASSSMFFLAVLFVSGFCAIAQPVIVALPLFRGLGVGLSVGSLYAMHGVQALGYVLVMLLPGTLLTTLAILLCCREALRLSCACWRGLFPAPRSEEPAYPVRLYLARYVVCAGFCCIVAFLEAAIHVGLAGFFQL